VREGLANKQIARRLGISERTVKAHLTSVFASIGVADRTQAAVWAERRGSATSSAKFAVVRSTVPAVDLRLDLEPAVVGWTQSTVGPVRRPTSRPSRASHTERGDVADGRP